MVNRVGSYIMTKLKISIEFVKLKEQSCRDQNLPFRKSQPEKRLPKIVGDLFRVKTR